MAWKFNGILSAFIANSSDALALLHDTTSKCQIDNQMFVCEVKFVSIISCSNVITGQCTQIKYVKLLLTGLMKMFFLQRT